MGFDIFMINHTKQQFDCLGTAGEGGNYNNDPNDFIKCWWRKGWRYGDDVQIGEGGDFDGYDYVKGVDDIEECKCFTCIRNPDKLYWTNITKKEAFKLYKKLKDNNKFAVEHNWDLEEDDIRCNSYEGECGEYTYLG